MSEHYTDGRRWSYISQAWIFADGWNDREEIARLEAKVRELEEDRDNWKRRHGEMCRVEIALRGMVQDLEGRLSEQKELTEHAEASEEYARAEWTKDLARLADLEAKLRRVEEERDQLRARVERLESALRHIAEARWSPRTTASYDEDARYAYPERESYVRQYAQRALEGKEEHGI